MGKKTIDLSATQDIAQELAGATRPAMLTSEHIEVKMIGSGGRLSAPAALHVRNYSFDDALLLAQATDETIDEALIAVLNGMLLEDLDAGLLHREEVKELLLAVHAAFWGKNLEAYYYAVDLERPMTPENRSVAELPISAIEIKELDRAFQEPLVVTSPRGVKIGFNLPRMNNGPIADRWLDQQHKEEETSFSDIRQVIAQNDRRPVDQQLPYDAQKMRAYEDFLARRSSDRARVLQALQVYSADGQVLATLDQKLAALGRDMGIFSRYLAERDGRFSFGVQPSVRFTCSVTHQEISRRFPFRCVDLIPPMDAVRDQGYSVSYG